MMNTERLTQSRILQRIRSVALEILDESQRKHSGEKRQARKVRPVQPKVIRIDLGHDVKSHVAVVHDPSPNTEGDHHRKIELRIDAEQRQDRQGEMAENEDHADIPPRTFLALHIPE